MDVTSKWDIVKPIPVRDLDVFFMQTSVVKSASKAFSQVPEERFLVPNYDSCGIAG